MTIINRCYQYIKCITLHPIKKHPISYYYYIKLDTTSCHSYTIIWIYKFDFQWFDEISYQTQAQPARSVHTPVRCLIIPYCSKFVPTIVTYPWCEVCFYFFFITLRHYEEYVNFSLLNIYSTIIFIILSDELNL